MGIQSEGICIVVSNLKRLSILERLLLIYARKFPYNRGKLRVINLFWRLAAGGNGTVRLAELEFSGARLQVDISKNLQRQYYFFGTYFVEKALLSKWQKLARKSHIVFDVGANFGIYSLAALSCSTQVKCYAFEPTPSLAGALKKNAKSYFGNRLIVENAAISDRVAMLKLYLHTGSTGDNEGMNFISDECLELADIAVSATSLDKYCTEHRIDYIDLLKIDIQGHEAFALRGARELLKNQAIRTILLELNWEEASGAGSPAEECVELLAHSGYKFASPSDFTLRDAGPWLRSIPDVFASVMPPDKFLAEFN